MRVLVVGGSQGAARLNAVVPHALARLGRRASPLEVRHQAGERWLEAARAATRAAGVQRAASRRSSTTWPRPTRWADLVICRAGALTVSELAGRGRGRDPGAVPAAVDDHQTHNAQFLVRRGRGAC